MVNKYIKRLPFSDSEKTALQKLVNRILDNKVSCTKIVLFGSYARAEHTIESDFDILVLTKEEISREKRGLLCSMFEENNADLVFYTEEQFADSTCLLVQCIKKEGVLLWKI